MNFVLMNDFSVALGDIENMIPFEREIYIALLQKSQKEKMKQMKK